MADEWRNVVLEELAAPVRNALVGGPFGSDLVSADYSKTGVPVIRGENLSGGRWVSGDFVFVRPEKAEKLSANTAGPLDIVFTQRGANHYRQVGIVPGDSTQRYLISQSQMKVTLDRKKADPLFVYYAFRSPVHQEYLQRHAIQTGVPHTNLSILKKVPLRLPPLRTQRSIAHILGTLDDKIELNRRINETLEAMARALFKSWFVDFDPVRAKADGRGAGLPQPIADLFPDSFENSELGEIPRGWEVKPFADTIEAIGGGTPKTSVAEYWDGNIPWFSVVDAPTDHDIWVVDTEKTITQSGVENSSTRVLPVGTTIISARGTVGRIALVGVPMAMNQSCYGLRGPAGTLGFFNYFSTRQLVARLQQYAHGSVFDTITRDTLSGLSVAVPPTSLVVEFERRVGPILERIRVALLDTRALATVRDTLLPKLISGELRVEGLRHSSRV
jgi:restriction endonuclease S subunit